MQRTGFSSVVQARIGASESARVLLLGQLGVGKSTEMWALEKQLSSTYCVLRPPAASVLNLSLAGWPEIFVYAALWAADAQNSRETRAARAVEEALGQPIYHMMVAINMAGGGGQVIPPSILQRFQSDMVELRKKISAAPLQFWDLATSVVRELETRSGRPALLLLDGLEKVPDEAARALFHEQRRMLSALPLRAVITAPVGLSFEPFFGDVEEAVSSVERLRALATEPGTPGHEFLRSLASRRGASEAFPEAMVEEAVEWSGGLPRQFVQLLAEAASRALSDGLTAVTKVCMLRARRRVAERFQYQLGPEDFAELGNGDADRSRTARSRLVRVGALVEFEDEDGTLHLAINPLVREIMTMRAWEAHNAVH
ncbi:MAG: hypothetical protein HYZ53_25800 [Planctomycetes bacterium]|nr:hypothetical protein [Planctomycetota bacterium]